MKNLELYKQFKALSGATGEKNTFAVVPVIGTNHKLGSSKEGYPKFFVCTNNTSTATPNTALDILSVEYNLSCTFVNDDNVEQPHHYTVITLHSLEQALQEIFFDITIMMFSRMPEIPTKREIAIEVENMISIFTAITCPPRKKIQGLWTELLVIERSANAEILAKAWHEVPTAKYDFTIGRDKLEVKSTSSETRIHKFALDQLYPTSHSRVVVASAIVRESAQGPDGLSVWDLYNKICNRIDSVEIHMHMMKVITESMGSEVHRLNDVFFDYVVASDTLRFYDSNDIPKIDKSGVQLGVTGVAFRSDLTGAIDLQSPESTFKREGSQLYMSLFQ